jgi:hypothetical protein
MASHKPVMSKDVFAAKIEELRQKQQQRGSELITKDPLYQRIQGMIDVYNALLAEDHPDDIAKEPAACSAEDGGDRVQH